MIYVLYTIHVVVSLFLILVVLLQQGKGADLSVFGGGGSQAAFGARGAANIFQRLTVVCFVLFILTTLSIGLFQGQDDSVMSGVAATEPAGEAEGSSAPPDIVEEGEGSTAPDIAVDEDQEPPPAEDGGADEEPPSGQ